MTFEEIMQEVRTLSVEERKQLIVLILDTMTDAKPKQEKKHNLLEFEGVGEHLRDMDVQKYVNQLRSEWDHRP